MECFKIGKLAVWNIVQEADISNEYKQPCLALSIQRDPQHLQEYIHGQFIQHGKHDVVFSSENFLVKTCDLWLKRASMKAIIYQTSSSWLRKICLTVCPWSLGHLFPTAELNSKKSEEHNGTQKFPILGNVGSVSHICHAMWQNLLENASYGESWLERTSQQSTTTGRLRKKEG